MQAVNRKSLLQRVGSGWLKRFSNRTESQSVEPACSVSLSQTQFMAHERSSNTIFRGRPDNRDRERVSLFPSSSEPAVGKDVGDEKENSFRGNWASQLVSKTPDRGSSRRGVNVRGSRSTTAQISRPMKVDEPKSKDEVNTQAENWRQMARHLQDTLGDPSGARELFGKAISHREKHGLWCTNQNAQAHVDLARNLSKGEMMKDAEFHLRIALRIYTQLETDKGHIADLMLYVGVVVDRQKRRKEAEELYRDALNIYKENELTGNNVEIAVKNLSLNLRKQDRESEIATIREEFGTLKKLPAIPV